MYQALTKSFISILLQLNVVIVAIVVIAVVLYLFIQMELLKTLQLKSFTLIKT